MRMPAHVISLNKPIKLVSKNPLIRSSLITLSVLPSITEEGEEEQQAIEYFEVVRIAYLQNTQYFVEYFGDDDICQNEINKNFIGLWHVTYHFVNEKQRIKVVNKDPDNLLVSWVAGCYTEFDIPKDTFV